VNHPTTIAVDLAKSVFEIAVSRHPGRVCQRRRLSRSQMMPFFSQHSPATVLLEACGSSHHWARQLESLGHRVLLLPAQHVRRYVLRDKTDRADATALLEAHRNEQIVPVPVKTLHHHTIAALHRLRSGWLSTRTARINTIRGLLRELGILIPQGPRHVLPRLAEALSDPSGPVPEPLHEVLLSAAGEIRELESRIADVERQLKTFADRLPTAALLMTIPGIGLLTSTALIGFVGDPSRFRSGRRFASYLGLVPREHSSGLQRRLGAITKRGDAYLRTLLIHGARSTLYAATRSRRPDRLRRWATAVRLRRGNNRAAVALANKLARIAWAVWTRNTSFTSAAEPMNEDSPPNA
jgi:transposase